MKLTLIDFWAEWCLPCKRIAPVLDRLAQEYQDKIDLVKIDADLETNEGLLRQFDVMSIPTLVLLRGDTVIGKKVGQTSELALREWIDDALEGVYSHG